jgi:ABC-type antimicrobial peptide transport system permease subunit
LALGLARNLIERRREFALLRAVGYRFGALVWLALSENLLLLAVGLLSGAACAVMALAPGLAARSVHPPWASLAGQVGAVLIVGVAATALSAALVLRTKTLRALKEE